MKVVILGGGLSAVSTAYYLQDNPKIDQISIIEKDDQLGGLCRTYEIQGIQYDVGPHIIFSKDSEVLTIMNELLEQNVHKLRRSNQIIYGKTFVQYPFENDLGKLPKEDIEYCRTSFLSNPYESYEAKNMLQFFLKTFGEGITNLYLRPYNEKIWKFDPCFMDTQMVERIPKPPKQDIIDSCDGKTIDGYLHQLYFTYPITGGIQEIVKSFLKKLNPNKVNIKCNEIITSINKNNSMVNIFTEQSTYEADLLISTIPLPELVRLYNNEVPNNVVNAAKDLKYNSIAICILNVKKDYAGENFAFMIADKSVIFHRLSKIDFLGDNYKHPEGITYLAEVTFREGDQISIMSDEELLNKVIIGLEKIGFIDDSKDINFSEVKRFKYAYVIYDLNHKQNVNLIKDYFSKEGILLNGRFGTFEYINMDVVIRNSIELAKQLR